MTTEFTRENRIKKFDLKIKWLGIHLTALTISFGIYAFVLGNTEYQIWEKVVVSIVIAGTTIYLLRSLLWGYGEIENIFKD
jgi:hypothetical protein